MSSPKILNLNFVAANKTCPPNSYLIDNTCQFPSILPTLTCDNGFVLKENGMCLQECPPEGKQDGLICKICEKGKFVGDNMCQS